MTIVPRDVVTIRTETRRAVRTMCATTLARMMHHRQGGAIATTTMIVDIAQVAEIVTATATGIEIETETETEIEIEVVDIRRKTTAIETEGTATTDREIDITTVTVTVTAIVIEARPAEEIETAANEVKTGRGETAKAGLHQAIGRKRTISTT